MAQLTVRRGDDKQYLTTFKQIDGTIQDLTGCTVLFTVKPSVPSDPTADLDDSSATLRYWWTHDGSTVTDSEGMDLPEGKTPGDGQLIVTFPRSLTTTLPKISQPYDVQITLPDPDGEDNQWDETWDSGDFSVLLDLTRRRTP